METKWEVEKEYRWQLCTARATQAQSSMALLYYTESPDPWDLRKAISDYLRIDMYSKDLDTLMETLMTTDVAIYKNEHLFGIFPHVVFKVTPHIKVDED